MIKVINQLRLPNNPVQIDEKDIYKIISKTIFVPKYDKNKIKKPIRFMFAALLPLHP